MNFPVYVRLFGSAVSAHQLLDVLAYAVGFQFYLYLRRRWPKGPALKFEQSGMIVMAATFGALLGSKLLAWAESYPVYWAQRDDLRLLLGGKTIVGALLGGWLCVEGAKRLMRIRQYSGDLYVFPVISGMCLGRVGCFLDGLKEQGFGTATSLPWGIDFGDGRSRHPTQLYEVAFLVFLAGVFAWRRRTLRQQGCMFSQFMGLYLGYRFLVEFIKPSYLLPVVPLSAIQVACLVGLVYALVRRQDDCCVASVVATQKPKERPELAAGESRFLELTSSLCEHCLAKIDAKVLWEQGGIYLRKFCPEHGISTVLIADDADYWFASRSVHKAPTAPLRRNSESRRGCPWDCGICPEHEQHSCLAVVEITDRCDQACPICYAASTHTAAHRTLPEVCSMLDAVVGNEGTVGVVQLSGGEPTLHPEFFEILDEVRRRPIRHVMVNSNGRRIAEDPRFVQRLAAYMPGLEIYLQFDSLRPDALREIRGADYSDLRRKAVAALELHGISTTLVVTLKKGVNDQDIGAIMDFALAHPSIRGVTFQPVQAAGRLGRFDAATQRLTLTEVRRNILSQHSLFTPADLVAVPCHTDALAMGYAVRTRQGVLPLSRLMDPAALLALGGNTICYEQDVGVRGQLEGLFSAGASPSSAAAAISSLCCGISPSVLRSLRKIDYASVFRVVVMQFMDAYSMDLRSLKRSCVHIVSREGKLVPFETYNLLHRRQPVVE